MRNQSQQSDEQMLMATYNENMMYHDVEKGDRVNRRNRKMEDKKNRKVRG